MVLSKHPHLSSVHSLKANLLHRLNSLPPALLLVTVAQLKQATELLRHGHRVRELLTARDLPLVKVCLRIRDSSLCPSSSSSSSRKARNQQANNSRRGLPSLPDSSHRVGHSNRRLDPPPSSPNLLLKARGVQGGDPHCSKNPNPRRSPVKTARLWAVLLH